MATQHTCVLLMIICFAVFSNAHPYQLHGGNADSTTQATAGFATALTTQGFAEVLKVAIPILEQKLRALVIPEISGSAHTPVGSIDYHLTDIRVESLSIGSSAIVPVTPGSTLKFSIQEIAISLHASWEYREHSWPHVSDHGTADITATASAVTAVVLGADANHAPTVTTGACSTDIEHLSLKLHGGASWLYNLFDSVIASSVKKSLNDQLCTIVTKEINTEGNKALSSLPLSYNISSVCELTYGLITSPETTENAFIVFSKGEFMDPKNPIEAPFAPAPFSTNTSSFSRMFYIWLSTYTLETAGWTYQQAGKLAYNVTNKDIPPSSPLKLNTTSLEPFIPGLFAQYPNMPVQLDMFSHGSPPIMVSTNSSGLYATVNMGVTTCVVDGLKIIPVFSINATVHLDGHIGIQVNGSTPTVVGNLTFVDVDLAISWTNVGSFDVSDFQALIDQFCEFFLLPKINKIAGQGFPIPVIAGVSLVGPQVSLYNDYILIDTDIEYS